jgi:hypothetical protein
MYVKFQEIDNKNKYLCVIVEFWVCEAVITEDILIILHTTLSVKEPFPIGIDVYVLLVVNFWLTSNAIMNWTLMGRRYIYCYLKF